MDKQKQVAEKRQAKRLERIKWLIANFKSLLTVEQVDSCLRMEEITNRELADNGFLEERLETWAELEFAA